MSSKKKTILFTFGRSFLTLSCARAFAAAGHRVIVADSQKFAISRYSNAVDSFYSVRSPRKNPVGYIEDLIDITKKENVNLVVPMWEDLCHVTMAKEQFPHACELFCPDFPMYHELLQKWSFQQLLDKMHIPHPDTHLITEIGELEKLPKGKTYAFKAVYSRASQNIIKYTSGNRLPKIDIKAHNPWVAQEWLEGKKYCTYSVCKDGKMRAHVVYPVRYTVDGHSCLTFKTVEHPQILEWVKDFISKIRYTGQIAFDFIETDDGKLWAIECNPRGTSGLLLFGRNQGFEETFFEEPAEMLVPKKRARRQVAAGMMMFGWKKKNNYSKSLLGYLKELVTTPDVVLSRRDPVPFLMQPYLFVQFLWHSRREGLSLPNYFIHDYIWDGK